MLSEINDIKAHIEDNIRGVLGQKVPRIRVYSSRIAIETLQVTLEKTPQIKAF